MIRPARAATASRIHSHSRLVPDPVPCVADAAGEAADADVAGAAVAVVVTGAAVAVVVTGAAVAVVVTGAAVVAGGAVVAGAVVPEPAEAVAVRLGVGKLLITLLAVLPQPAARQARTRMAADRERLFAGCRMPILPRCSPA